MAISGTRIKERLEYISEADPSKSREDGATIWHLGALTVDQRTDIQDGVMLFGSGDQSIRMQINRQNITAVRLGLKGVENWVDQDGKPIPFETEDRDYLGTVIAVPSDKFLQTMPDAIIREIGRKILQMNSVQSSERKN